MTWDPYDKQRAAFHETGHAVVAWSFEVPVGFLELDLVTEGGHIDADGDRLKPVAQIAIRLAGFEAEEAFKPPARKRRSGDDFGHVSRILRENGTPEGTPVGDKMRKRGRRWRKRACGTTSARCAALPTSWRNITGSIALHSKR